VKGKRTTKGNVIRISIMATGEEQNKVRKKENRPILQTLYVRNLRDTTMKRFKR
jgi:hypothetical protein